MIFSVSILNFEKHETKFSMICLQTSWLKLILKESQISLRKQNNSFLINKQFCFYGLGQNFSFLTMLVVKICNIRNEKMMRQIFYMLQSTWKFIRKSSKSWKNVAGKISHFCLGLKTWLGHFEPCFDLSSKISVAGSIVW